MSSSSRVGLRLAAVVLLACGSAAAQQAPPQSLGAEVQSFLSEWLRGSADKAADLYMSAYSETRPQVLPFGRGRAPGLDKAPTRQQFASDLQRLRDELWRGPTTDALTAGTTMDSIADVLPALRERDINPVPIDPSQTMGFPVRKFDDLTWTGSAGPRHRVLFEDASLKGGTPFWGVIVRLRTSGKPIVPMLLLWRAEPAPGAPAAWKLLTMLPVLTQ